MVLSFTSGIATPDFPNDVPLEQLKNICQYKEVSGAKLCEDIQNRRDDLKEGHKCLTDIQEKVARSQELKVAATDNEAETLIKLEKLQETVKKIAEEKSIIKMELEFKEKECQLLSELKESGKYHRFLERKIAKKKEKTKRLKEELQKKECEFLSVQKEAQKLQEELSQARAEVKKKHEEMEWLKREKEKLAYSYNMKREHISHLVQTLVALSSNKEEIKVKSVQSILHSATGLQTEGEHI